jgi:hypothetical protein
MDRDLIVLVNAPLHGDSTMRYMNATLLPRLYITSYKDGRQREQGMNVLFLPK